MKAIEAFHEHLEQCHQCERNPFALCPTGQRLLREAAGIPAPKEKETLTADERRIMRGPYWPIGL